MENKLGDGKAEEGGRLEMVAAIQGKEMGIVAFSGGMDRVGWGEGDGRGRKNW